MSTTFTQAIHSDDSVFQEVPNDFFDPSLPEHKYDNPRTNTVCIWPQLEVTYSNARPLMNLCDIHCHEDDLTGRIALKELHNVMHTLIKIGASEKMRKPMVHDDHESNHFFHAGNSDDRVYRYVFGLMEVVNCCIENQRDLVWY